MKVLIVKVACEKGSGKEISGSSSGGVGEKEMTFDH